MGGSNRESQTGTNDYRMLIDEAKEETRDKSFEADVSRIISDILSEYNKRDSQEIRSHLDKIIKPIEDEFAGIIELLFGGSVSKHTYVDGLSDVDVLVLIDKSELSDLSPKSILNIFRNRILSENLKDVKKVTVGDLAATVDFYDGTTIQLLPALKRYEGFKIPQKDVDSWSNVIRPDKFAKRLTEVNYSCNRNVVPVIKLAKGIIDNFMPHSLKLTGYHIESLAIETFKLYPKSNPKTQKVMLTHFFEKMSDLVKEPIVDKTGQSRRVDEYLGGKNSESRQKASMALGAIYRKMRDANETGKVSKWKKVLGV